jgi:hypothetical protein
MGGECILTVWGLLYAYGCLILLNTVIIGIHNIMQQAASPYLAFIFRDCPLSVNLPVGWSCDRRNSLPPPISFSGKAPILYRSRAFVYWCFSILAPV